MTGRDRILAAFDGRPPDRVPRALNFRPVDLASMAPPGACRDDLVDLQFVRLPPSPEEEELGRTARPYAPDTRVGTPEQIAAYRRWSYAPEAPDRRNPLARATSLEALQAFPFPDISTDYHVEGLPRQVEEIRAKGLAAGGGLPHLGGELFESAWRLRGLERFLLDLVDRPDWAHYLVGRLTAFARRNAEALARAGVDLLVLDDDVGMPGRMVISPEAWRTFFKPRFADIVQAVKAIHPSIRVAYHSDGCIAPILDDLIDIGVRAVHPVQPEHMDAAWVRRRYGARLVLYGTVGSQTTFGTAAPGRIRAEVETRIRTLGREALILCPAYDLTAPDVPWENLAAFLDAVEEFG